MPELFTPLSDGPLGRSSVVNDVLQEMEDNILARNAALIERIAWTTLTADTPTLSIPVSNGDDGLKLMLALRTDRAGAANDSIRIRINNESANNYQTIHMLSTGPATTPYSATTGFQLDFGATAATATAGLYSYVIVRLALAAAAVAKIGRFETVHVGAAGGTVSLLDGGLFYPAGPAITSLQIVPVNGTNILSGSQYALYGMAGL